MSKMFRRDWASRLKGKRVAIICPKHGFFALPECPKCAEEESKAVAGPAMHVWKARYFRDLDVKPIYVESKRQLRKECRKRNLKAACLM